MNDTTQGAPAAAPDTTAADSTNKPPAEVQQAAGGEGEQQTAAKPELTEEQRQIRRLERKLDKAYRHNARLHSEVETVRKTGASQQTRQGAGDGAGEQPQHYTPEQVQEILQRQRAADQGAQVLTEGITKTVKEGSKAYRDFDQRTNELVQQVDLIGPGNQPTPFLEAILDCESPHEVIYHLATNPDVAEEIAELTPRQQIRRLAQLESELAAKPKPSAAPKPLTPVNGSNAGNKSDDRMSDREWAEKRRAEKAARARR